MANQKSNWHSYLILLAVVVIVFGYWLVIMPGLNQAKHDNQLISQRKQEATVLEDRLQAINEADSLLKKNPDMLNQLTMAMPEGNDVGSAMVAIEALAAKDGVSLLSIEPGKGDDTTGVLPVTIHLQAGYPNLIDFMTATQKNLRPITIQTNTITKPQEGDVLDATMVLSFSYSPKPTPTQTASNLEAAALPNQTRLPQ